MPYASEKQRRFMHAKHPDIAARWDAEYGGQIASPRSRGGQFSGGHTGAARSVRQASVTRTATMPKGHRGHS